MNLQHEPRQAWRERPVRTLAVTLLCLLLALAEGCGGSGGVDSGGTGMAPETLAVGPISGYGSIVVGGVHYDETLARLEDADGHELPASALVLGAMTRIDASAITSTSTSTGTRQAALAQTVRISEALIGPVTSIDVPGSSLVVLGQTVVVNAGTVFEASMTSGVSALTPGRVLAVHGLLDTSAGRIVATRIEPRPDASAYVVRAPVTALDRAAQRMALGALNVTLNELPSLPSALEVGSLVRVKLRTTPVSGVSNTTPVNGVWAATQLRLDSLSLPDRDTVEIEGRVDAFTSAQTFSVDGIRVDASAASFSGTVALGVRVEVTGSSRNGSITARRVEVDDDDGGGSESIELEGRVTAVDSAARTFVLRGVTVEWSSSTRFSGGTAADIVLNRRLHAKGRLAVERTHVDATSIQIED